MTGVVKVGLGALLLAAVAGGLVVAATGARERGRETYCRNNLRKLGEMAHQKLESEVERTAGGREFWQEVRVENFTTLKGGREVWGVRFGGLNPFGCPVRGVQPLDLSRLTPDDLARHMSDPSTIDYRGPTAGTPADPKEPEILGADLPGNHASGGGHVLLIDLTVRDLKGSIQVKPMADVPGVDARVKP